MQKRIRFGGVSTLPSDYDSPEGQIAVSSGISYNGAVIPARAMEEVSNLTLAQGETMRFVHQTSMGDRYITSLSGTQLVWHDGSSTHVIYNGEVSDITAVGNTLVLLTADGVQYVAIKDGEYVLLGSKPPFVELEFGLSGQMIASGGIQMPYEDHISQGYITLDPDTDQAVFNDKIYALVNYVIDFAREHNMFLFPFFVRYAYRMYDGTLMYHSAPVLLTPNIGVCPSVTGLVRSGTGNQIVQLVKARAMLCTLVYHQMEDIRASLAPWSDIVRSVDVFVSSPLITIDTEANVSKRINVDFPEKTTWQLVEPDNYFFYHHAWDDETQESLCKLNYSQQTYPSMPTEEQARTYAAILGYLINTTTGGFPKTDIYYTQPGYSDAILQVDGSYTYEQAVEYFRVQHPNYTAVKTVIKERHNDIYELGGNILVPLTGRAQDLFGEDMKSTAVFHKIASIPVASLATSRSQVPITTDTVKNLVFQEAMSDEYRQHDIMTASAAVTSNGRNVLGGLAYTLFGGFRNMQAHTDGTYLKQVAFVTYIRENGSDYTVVRKISNLGCHADVTSSIINIKKWLQYLYYPNTQAYAMDIYVVYASILHPDRIYKTPTPIPLTPHNGLNGSYASFYGQEIQLSRDDSADIPAEGIVKSGYPSKVVISTALNPMRFEPSMSDTFGNGKVLAFALSSRYQTRSEDDPFNPFTAAIYIFTDEGVYVTELNDEGRPASNGVVSRDILTDSRSITRCGNDIAFFTAKGIMVLRGQDSVCITDILNSEEVFSFSDMDSINQMIDSILRFPLVRFEDYLVGGGMAYDYLNGRLVVYNPTKSWHYIFDTKSKAWLIDKGTWDYTVHNWPFEMVARGGKLYTFGTDAATETIGQETRPVLNYFVTRPFRLAENNMTTIRQAILHGVYNTAQVYLYASLDGKTYYPIAADRGHHAIQLRAGSPYLAYRLVVVTRMQGGESLSDILIDYDIRQPHRLY